MPKNTFEKRFDRRKRDDVKNPRKETDLSFAARLAFEQARKPDRSRFETVFRKVKP